MRVSMQGKSLAKGSVSDRVLVCNLTSGTRDEGVITHAVHIDCDLIGERLGELATDKGDHA